MFDIFGGMNRQIEGAVQNQQRQGASGILDAAMRPFNPDEFQGFDNSSLRQALNQAIRRGASSNRAASLAAAQKGGALSSGQMQTGLGDVSAQQAEQENLMNANLARQDWMDRMRQYENRQNMLGGLYGQTMGGINKTWDDYYGQQRKDSEAGGNLLGLGAGIAAKKFGLF